MKKFLAAFIFSTLIIISSAEASPVRIGVADFVDKTSGKNYTVPREITEKFMNILDSYSSNINVSTSKSFQNLNSLTAESAANAGRSEGCKYVVLGAIISDKSDFMMISKPGLLYDAPVATEHIQIMNISVRLIEAETGKIVLSVSGVGRGSYTISNKEAIRLNATKEGKQKMIDDLENIRKIAFDSASSMAAEKICAFLTGEYPEVINIKAAPPARRGRKTNSAPSTVTINKGSDSGVGGKTFYKIFYEGEEIFDSGNNSLGREKFNIAVAEVTSSRTNSSVANITGGTAANIRTGDKAEQITPEEAQLIIDNKDFIKKRRMF
ncbi:MAG: hypothetical protein IJT21_07300 [Synergistaceae bacterium]|nr:hypothetical protein [Synergistaceae bacterium]